MREILFRGKKFKTPHDELIPGWVYGFYCSNSGAHFITHVVEPDSGGCYFSDILVDPETVGQFTGLIDKNDVMIFEGDIVDTSGTDLLAGLPNSTLGVVEWDDRIGGFNPFADYYSDCGIFTEANKCVVVGNIHDNPELLEVR